MADLFSNALAYEGAMGRWSARLAPLFATFAHVTDGGRVLDVGCGTGSLVKALADMTHRTEITGIDPVRPFVEYCRARFADPRIAFDCGDALNLPYPAGVFDHTLSLLVLMFIPEPEKAASEMRRVTRPGGTVAAATWDSRGGFVWMRMFWDTAAMIDPEAGARRAKTFARPIALPGGLERVWKTAGLTDVVQDMLTIRMDFSSFGDFWAPMEGKDGPFADYVRTLTPEAKAILRDKLRLAYVDGEADGTRSYAATAWAVRGKVPV